MILLLIVKSFPTQSLIFHIFLLPLNLRCEANCSYYASSWTASVSPCHVHGGVVMLHYPSRGQRDTIICPYCYGYILGPSNSCELTLSSHVSTNPPLRPPVTSPDLLLSLVPSSLDSPTLPRPVLCACALPFLAAPLAPLGSWDAFPVGGSEPSLNARIYSFLT